VLISKSSLSYFVCVRVNSWIVLAQNTIHETTRNNTKHYEITRNDEAKLSALIWIPN